MIWRWLRNLFCGSWRVKYLATGIGVIEDLRTRQRKKVRGVFTIEENDSGERRAFFSAESYPISPVSVEDVLRGVGAIGEWKNKRVGE